MIHGLKNIHHSGLIRIKGELSDDFIELSVSDNGCGFNYQAIQSQLDEENNIDLCYGLYNVHNRIRLYYGEKYGLFFSRSSLGGARIIVKLPRKKEVI